MPDNDNPLVKYIARRVVTNDAVIENGTVLVRGHTIDWVGPQASAPDAAGARVVDAGERTLLPGFVDIHVHGNGGVLAGESDTSLRQMARTLAGHGTTTFLPTLGGIELEPLMQEVARVGAQVGTDLGGADAAGIHMEGPFLSSEDVARGSQNVVAMRKPSVAELRGYHEASGGTLRYMTIAPEQAGALDVIEAMVDLGITPSAGHTTATYEDMDRAIAAGLRSVCHTFNGMIPMHHRRPGTVGAALTRKELNAELIGDGQHVSPVAMRVLYACKGPEGISIITDNTEWAGQPDGRYSHHGDGKTIIKQGDRCWVEGGTLAGSVTPMNRIVATVQRATGCSLVELARMASANPARVVGLSERKGSLSAGKDADLIAVDDAFEVALTVVRGREALRAL